MTWEYTIPEGKHYHRGRWRSGLRSLLRPVWPWVKEITIEAELDPAYWKNPDRFQVPAQLNKVFGFALMGLPHWYSLRLAAACYPASVEFYRYEYRGGLRMFSFEKAEYRPVPVRYTFDLYRWKKLHLPWVLRWLPMWRLHSYYGGRLPAPEEMTTRITEIKNFNSLTG